MEKLRAINKGVEHLCTGLTDEPSPSFVAHEKFREINYVN